MSKEKRRGGGSGGTVPSPGVRSAQGAGYGHSHDGTRPREIPEWQKTGYSVRNDRGNADTVIDDSNDHGYYPADTIGVPPIANMDSMGATGVDPSLVDERSRTVREHVGRFWINDREKSAPGRTRGAGHGRAVGETEEIMPETPDEIGRRTVTGKSVSGPVAPAQTHPGSRTITYVVSVLAVIFLVAILISTELFRVTDIRVVGNKLVSTEEIIRISGVKKGDNVLALDERQIGEAISANRYLKLVLMEHNNHTVTLRVYEREPAAYTVVRGIYYVLDRRGMVLEEYAQSTGLDDKLPQVDKLGVRSCVVGKHLTLYDSNVMDAYIQLMLEFHAMDLEGQIAVLYLDDLGNISLSTRSGYYVRLGDAGYLHGKLRSMTLTMEALRERNCAGGTIDVSVRDKPTYSPELTAAPI